MSTLLIEAMRSDDWPAVRSIYLEGIAARTTFETEAPSWQDWNASHHQFGRLVARETGRVLGWAALSPVSRRQVYAGVAEVSVCVAADSRGRGVGRTLLEKLISESEQNGICACGKSINTLRALDTPGPECGPKSKMTRRGQYKNPNPQTRLPPSRHAQRKSASLNSAKSQL